MEKSRWNQSWARCFCTAFVTSKNCLFQWLWPIFVKTSLNTVTKKGLGEGGIYFLEMHTVLYNPVNEESTLDYPDVCTTHKESLKVNQNLIEILQVVHIDCFFQIHLSSLISYHQVRIKKVGILGKLWQWELTFSLHWFISGKDTQSIGMYIMSFQLFK